MIMRIHPMNRTTPMVLLLCVMFSLTSCVILPIPTTENKVLVGKRVTEEQISFLVPNLTTKRDVIEQLGNPNVIWEDIRVFVYNWEMRQGILFWAVGGFGGGAADIWDIPKHYLLLIQFNEQDLVQRFERTTRPISQSYADFLKEWGGKFSVKSPSNRHGQGE